MLFKKSIKNFALLHIMKYITGFYSFTFTITCPQKIHLKKSFGDIHLHFQDLRKRVGWYEPSSGATLYYQG